MSEPGPVKRLPAGTARLAGVGVELAAAVGGGCLLGYWIDRRLQTSPWALVICAILGIMGGLYNVMRQATQEASRTTRPGKDRSQAGPGGKVGP